MTDHTTNPAIRLATALENLAAQIRDNPELFRDYSVARAGAGSTSGLLLVVGRELTPAFAQDLLNIAIEGPEGLSQVINVDVSQPSG